MNRLASRPPGTSGSAMALSRGLRPSLRGTLMVVATEAMAMAMAMAITVAAATATREVALPRWGDEMALCDGKARAYAADNAGAGATADQLTCTWAALWSK